MIAELGTYSLILALVVSAITTVAGLWGAQRRDVNLMALASVGMLAMTVLSALAFGLLAWLFVTSDFTAAVVYENSHTTMPLFFRIAGTWGNHEGSMMLWVMVLTLFGGSIALMGGRLPPTLRARVLGVQGLIALSFLVLMLFTSNPFARLPFVADEGRELNPLLQDVGLAIHPPFLYLGYVGFSVTFAFAVAALIEGKVDAAWARFLRPWVLAAWVFLTIGITLGSSWAYYELGWGGWWYWDPVENASFMPWLVGTALLHSALVVERRGALISWTVLLAILTYSLSLIGTFLVRSGVLTSVHSFAADPNRGLGVLLMLGLSTGGALTLFALRSRSFGQPVLFGVVSREGGLVLNNILLLAACGTVFLGTFYPLFVELVSADRISVGPPYFNMTFGPLMLPLLFSVVVGANLRWKRDTLRAALKRGVWAAAPALLILGGILVYGGLGKAAAAIGLALSAWLILGIFAHWSSRVNLLQGRLDRSLALALNAPRAFYGMLAAHLGLGVTLLGIIVTTTWSVEAIKAVAPGETITLASYEIRLDRIRVVQGPNYEAEQGTFVIARNGSGAGEMVSERRFFTASGRQTTEAAIRMSWFSNLYIALGEADATGRRAVRAYFHPLVAFIWFGPLLMALGGVISLTDRRFRVGAPARRGVGLAALAGE